MSNEFGGRSQYEQVSTYFHSENHVRMRTFICFTNSKQERSGATDLKRARSEVKVESIRMMEHVMVQGPEVREETTSLTMPTLCWEIPWIDPNDVRLALVGIIAALRRNYDVGRQKPEEGTFGFTQTGGVCMDFIYVTEERGDEGGEGREARHTKDMIKELIFGVLGHTALWLRGHAGLSHEWIRRGVLCPKTIHDAWKAFSKTGSLAELGEAISKADVVSLGPGAWVLSEMTQEWVRAWKARHIASWMRKLEDEKVIRSAEEVLDVLNSTQRRKAIRTVCWTKEYLLCCVEK